MLTLLVGGRHHERLGRDVQAEYRYRQAQAGGQEQPGQGLAPGVAGCDLQHGRGDGALEHGAGAAAVYWPRSQCPGAMSSRASAGPHEPGAYPRAGGGLVSSGSATCHTAASPSGRVNSERSPSRTSWISRTYGGSGSAPCRLASGRKLINQC